MSVSSSAHACQWHLRAEAGATDTFGVFRSPAMVHSPGLNSAAHGSGNVRIAAPCDWQRVRSNTGGVTKTKPPLMWALSDGRRVSAEGTFPPPPDGGDIEADGDLIANLIW